MARKATLSAAKRSKAPPAAAALSEWRKCPGCERIEHLSTIDFLGHTSCASCGKYLLSEYRAQP